MEGACRDRELLRKWRPNQPTAESLIRKAGACWELKTVRSGGGCFPSCTCTAELAPLRESAAAGGGLTRVPLVVLEHVDLLRELAVALPALVLLDALVQLHVVAQCVLGLHACGTERSGSSGAPAPHNARPSPATDPSGARTPPPRPGRHRSG